MTIKLKDIIPAPWNPREDITPESVAELAADIEANGLINPITVWNRESDGAWLCIAGNRRLAALRALNTTDDIALPKDHYTLFGGDETEARAVTFRENHHRKQLSPLGEAAQVAQFLADGLTHKDAARALGISVAKAKRREKLNALDDAWKARADAIEVDALERIACYPAAVQQRVAKVCANYATKWKDVQYQFGRESRDLDEAAFDTHECRACECRTGAQADLFGVCDGKLGACQDCKCFDMRLKAFTEAAVAAATKGACEVVKVDYEWQMPREDETKPKRDKAHPCAYAYIKDDGSVEVRWGASKKAQEAAAKAKREADEAERSEQSAKSERIRAVCAKLDTLFTTDDDDDAYDERTVAMLSALFAKTTPQSQVEYIVAHIIDGWNGWRSHGETAEIVATFPKLADIAGLTDAEKKELLAERED